ncbi:MAG: DUF3887 domain-containing protein [Puia sp.]|nr:DUF3887 domain-containing protein [Puia sp.]
MNVKAEYIAEDKQLTEQEIKKFHGRFNSEDYDSIWNQAAPGLQQAVSKKDFLTFLNNGHQQCGKFKGIIDKRVNVVGGSPVQIRVIYNSQFDKAVLTEMFTWLKTGEEIQLAGYIVAKGPAELPRIGQ